MITITIEKTLELPHGCSDCEFCNHDYGSHGGRRPYCEILASITKNWNTYDVDDNPKTPRPRKCPLKDGLHIANGKISIDKKGEK